MKCRFCDKPPFQGSQARGAEHFTKGRCPKVTPEVLVDSWNTTQYPFDERRERQVRDYMEYRGIRNNREVGGGVPEDDEVQDVLDREGADSEGGQCGSEDDEMNTGAEGEGEGPTEDGGEDNVQELGAYLQGGSLKARPTAHQTRTRAPMDGRGKRRADTAPTARVPDPKRLKQVRLDEMYNPEWQTTFDHLFLQWWYIGSVPFERARMAKYRALTRHLQNMPRGMKTTLPQFKRIAGSGIQEERAYIVDKLRDIREQMQHTGATILTDGRKSLNSEHIVNFLAAGQSGAFLFTTVRREGVDAETSDVVLQCWKKVFEKFGVKNINAICTNSASVYDAAGRALCNDPDLDTCRIPWLPCSVHCCNLMLLDMVKDKTWAIDLLTRARAVVRFIRCHGSALALFRSYSARPDRDARADRLGGSAAGGEGTVGRPRRGRELLYPCQTRFTSMYIMMERLHDRRLAEEIRKLESTRPRLVGMLQDCYARACHLLEPTHAPAHLLNPKRRNFVYFQSPRHSDQQKKVAEITLEYIYMQTGFDRQGARYRLVRQQLYDFHARGQRYDWGGDAGTGDEDTCERSDETQGIADWWVLHGSYAPELCAIATRLMYTWVCASPTERNWALHERIHEKRRNGLDFTKLTEMVEMCANKKLLACRERRRGLVLLWGDLKEGLDDVPEPRRSGTLPPGSLTDEEIARQARRMQRASTVRHPPAVQTVFRRRAAHIELYHEEIEYDPPTDPHAADEMEAEPWTDSEDLEQRGSDTPDVGDESGGESDHEAASDMRSRDRQSHCDVDRMTPPLTRSATDRGRKQTKVVRSSSEDEGGDRSDDGDAADDKDSDVEREGLDQDRGHGDEHGFDGGDDSGPIEEGAGGAFLVTPSPSAVGGGGSGGTGFGLEVQQGSIPSGIFSDSFDLGRPPTSDARRGGVRVQTPVSGGAHLIGSVFGGASSGLLTEAARASGEIQEGRTGDDVGRVARRLHMDPEDVVEEERLARMVSGCATTQRLALEQDTTRAREMGCSVEEVTAARLAAECRHDGPADVADGGGLCTEGHMVDRADDHQEDERVGLGGLCRASDTVLPTTDEAEGGDGAATTDAGGLLGCDGTEVEGQVDKALVGVAIAAKFRLYHHPKQGCLAFVGGRSGISGGSIGWGEGYVAPATARGRGQVQGSPSPSSKAKGKFVSWSSISRVTRKLKDAMPGVTGERRDREGRLTEMFADATGWVRKGDRLEHPGAGSSCAADRWGSTMVAPPSRPPTAGAAQRDGHRRPKGDLPHVLCQVPDHPQHC
ncbi:hypothetical protein CBR_g46249 [Chara braunii]|uniref:DUF659 domain-containing protein n=1 Tax=Chara braunii TaxID=69332 RepID=A0A388K3W2_CHABU|nr:hypothetical protein CBR_g46249 [Chara braunii]|eukprot:GBG64706.1 hypothetical protein CBR_g46249 [Chara braunii]